MLRRQALVHALGVQHTALHLRGPYSGVSGKQTGWNVSQSRTSRGGCRGEHVGHEGGLGWASWRDNSRCLICIRRKQTRPTEHLCHVSRPRALDTPSGAQWHEVLFSGWGDTHIDFPVSMWILLHFSKHLLTCQQPSPLRHFAEGLWSPCAAPNSTLQGQLQTPGSLEQVRRRGDGPQAPQEALLTPPWQEVSQEPP